MQSWMLLCPKPEIILLGSDKGVAETCKEFGLVHIPDVDRNEYGTPLVSSIFQNGQAKASFPVVCYINADIMLMNNFVQAVKTVITKMDMFLVLGQRTDIDIREPWDFKNADWEASLKKLLAQSGALHAASGIDLFCFPRGMYTEILPFAIGRPGFDNWLVWQAKSKNVPIVDVTQTVQVVHQNHESSYILRKLTAQEVGSMKTRNDPGKVKYDGNWIELGPESQQNIALLPQGQNLNIWDANWIIDQKGGLKRRRFILVPAYQYYHLKRMAQKHCPLLYKIIHGRKILRLGHATSR